MTKLIVAFRNFENAPKMTCQIRIFTFCFCVFIYNLFRYSHQETNKTYEVDVNRFVDMF